MNKISAYILTKNSEKYIEEILQKIENSVDELCVIDSGSTDKTAEIAQKFAKVKFVYHKFENFKSQRLFAERFCSNDLILFLDSDEVPDNQFVTSLKKIRETDNLLDAYVVERRWNVLGKNVHCIYPVVSPDYPIRLYNRQKVSFEKSRQVHEKPVGSKKQGQLDGFIKHITFETKDELYRKLEFYTDIEAEDMIRRGKKINRFKLFFSPVSAFVKWYLLKKGFLDGKTGLILGVYAFNYTRKKYFKALMRKNKSV